MSVGKEWRQWMFFLYKHLIRFIYFYFSWCLLGNSSSGNNSSEGTWAFCLSGFWRCCLQHLFLFKTRIRWTLLQNKILICAGSCVCIVFSHLRSTHQFSFGGEAVKSSPKQKLPPSCPVLLVCTRKNYVTYTAKILVVWFLKQLKAVQFIQC